MKTVKKHSHHAIIFVVEQHTSNRNAHARSAANCFLALLRRGDPRLRAGGERPLLACSTAGMRRPSILRTQQTVGTAPAPLVPAGGVGGPRRTRTMSDGRARWRPRGGGRPCRASLMPPRAAAVAFRASCKPPAPASGVHGRTPVSQLGEATHEETALALVVGQRKRALERGPGLARSAKPAQQLSLGRMQVGIALQGKLLHHTQRRLR